MLSGGFVHGSHNAIEEQSLELEISEHAEWCILLVQNDTLQELHENDDGGEDGNDCIRNEILTVSLHLMTSGSGVRLNIVLV